jgi:hypothetical protein
MLGHGRGGMLVLGTPAGHWSGLRRRARHRQPLALRRNWRRNWRSRNWRSRWQLPQLA